MCLEISRDIKRYQEILSPQEWVSVHFWAPHGGLFGSLLSWRDAFDAFPVVLGILGVLVCPHCSPHVWQIGDKPSHTAALQHPLSKTWHCGTAFPCRFCWKSTPQIVSCHRFCCFLEQFLQTTSCHGSLQTTSSSQHRWIEHVAQWVRGTPDGGSRIRRLLTLQDTTGHYTSSQSFPILIHNIYIYM